MRDAVSALVGEEVAAGQSPNVVARLKREWWDEYGTWKKRGLEGGLGVCLGGRHPQWPARG